MYNCVKCLLRNGCSLKDQSVYRKSCPFYFPEDVYHCEGEYIVENE